MDNFSLCGAEEAENIFSFLPELQIRTRITTQWAIRRQNAMYIVALFHNKRENIHIFSVFLMLCRELRNATLTGTGWFVFPEAFFS